MLHSWAFLGGKTLRPFISISFSEYISFIRSLKERKADIICAWFQGLNCCYSHNAADSDRRPEVCKYYKRGNCSRDSECVFLHGESPCKAFHKGECTMVPCRFSHLPLNEFTKPIYEQVCFGHFCFFSCHMRSFMLLNDFHFAIN